MNFSAEMKDRDKQKKVGNDEEASGSSRDTRSYWEKSSVSKQLDKLVKVDEIVNKIENSEVQVVNISVNQGLVNLNEGTTEQTLAIKRVVQNSEGSVGPRPSAVNTGRRNHLIRKDINSKEGKAGRSETMMSWIWIWIWKWMTPLLPLMVSVSYSQVVIRLTMNWVGIWFSLTSTHKK
jgi:hypothetical protein